jgi:hypothetical protein
MHIADAQFLALQRPLFSLYALRAAIYSPVPFIGCILAPLTSSFDLVVLPI